MYTFGSAINRQGAITIPRTPVIRPPVRKLISLGRAFEKSYEGLTMLAATLTDRVATASVKRAKTTTRGLSNFPVSVTGSQIGAAQFSNRRTAFIPRRMMKMLITQKIAKLSHWVQCWPATIAELVQLAPKSLPAST